MISVIIPTFNRRNILEGTDAFQQDFPADFFVIMVVETRSHSVFKMEELSAEACRRDE